MVSRDITSKNVPPQFDVTRCTLEALRERRGIATNAQIKKYVVETLRISPELSELTFGGGSSVKVLDYRLTKARTILGGAGLVHNVRRGVWALAEVGAVTGNSPYGVSPLTEQVTHTGEGVAILNSVGDRDSTAALPTVEKEAQCIVSLVDCLSRGIPTDHLIDLADRFAYSKGEKTLLDRGSDYRRQTFLTLSQAYDLVEWKSDRQKRRFRVCNTNDAVMQATKLAARQADESPDSPEKAADTLVALKGVHYPTASVFLTAWDPQQFGILDARTWSALHKLTGLEFFDRGRRTLFQVGEFRLYTLLLRYWSEQGGREINPRLLDKALWQYDVSGLGTLTKS